MKQAHLYILNAIGSDHYKIGVTTKTPEHRISQMQTGNPLHIESVGSAIFPESEAYRLEAACHAAFREYRLNGEWFDLNPVTATSLLMALRSPDEIRIASAIATRYTGADVTVYPSWTIKPDERNFCPFYFEACAIYPDLEDVESFAGEFWQSLSHRFYMLEPGTAEEAAAHFIRGWTEDLSPSTRHMIWREPHDAEESDALIRSFSYIAARVSGARRTKQRRLDLAVRHGWIVPGEPDGQGGLREVVVREVDA